MINETLRDLLKRIATELYVRGADGDWVYEELTSALAEQLAVVAVVLPDLTELREYHAKAVKDLEHYADDSGLRESDVKHYRKRAEFHAKQVALIDSLKS